MTNDELLMDEERNNNDPLGSKSMDFAVRIHKLYKHLIDQSQYHIANQIFRSATSIGANLAESRFASSDIDFRNKLKIASKECSETLFWLELLYRTTYKTKNGYQSLYKDCAEIHKMLIASTKTLTDKINKRNDKTK